MPSRAQSLQRSLNLFRKEGFRCDITERWVTFGGSGGTRKDLFGFIDFVALGHGLCVAVQACAGDVAGHLRKIRGEPNYKRSDGMPEGEERDVARDKAAAAALKIRENLALWLEAGNPVVVVGWRTLRVGERDLWKPRIVWVAAHDEEEFEDQRIAFSSAGLFRERRRA